MYNLGYPPNNLGYQSNNYGYQPNNYGNGAMPDNLSQLRMQQMPQQMSQMQAAPQPAQPASPIIWVQGEAGAKSYLVAPGNTVMLLDSENSTFYLKSADASGMPMPLRIFDYKERTAAQNQPVSGESSNVDKFVTRDEFERKMAEIAAMVSGKDVDNEPSV